MNISKYSFSSLCGISTLFLACSCGNINNSQAKLNIKLIQPDGKTIAERFLVPDGYERLPLDSDSFGYYLRTLPLKKPNTAVLLYDGSEKSNQGAHVAVIDMEIGNRNLQQCADAVIRLRAEYLYSNKRFNDIQFHFTNGQICRYFKWVEGYRAVENGNNIDFVLKAKPGNTYKIFRQYLDLVFTYAGTLSLSKELIKAASISDIKPGDVFIKGGSPGHAVIVVDVAVNKKTGKKIFLLAQSYMPAQDIHVLKNPKDSLMSPWYSEDFGDELVTPEWTFNNAALKCFE